MSRRYLVTGGTGFIGSALVKRLIRDGHHVTVFDNQSRGRVDRLAEVAGEAEIIEGDVRNAAAVSKAARGAEGIFHLAYVNGTRFFYESPDLVLDIAVRGMLSVLDAAKENGVSDLFLASSSEVYQDPPAVPTDESAPLVVPDPLNPRYSYGGGKIICELLALHQASRFMRRTVVFRPHNVYGPAMGWEHVIPELTMRVVRAARAHPAGRLPFRLQGTGDQTRAFTFIDDFIDGLILVAERGETGNVYHIGNPEEVSIGDLAHRIARCLGREVEIIPSDAPAGATRRRCPDIGKISKLGFGPAVRLDQGLPPTVDWYVKNTPEEKLKEYVL